MAVDIVARAMAAQLLNVEDFVVTEVEKQVSSVSFEKIFTEDEVIIIDCGNATTVI